MRRDFTSKPALNEAELSRAMRSMAGRVPPAGLTTSLRILASRERQRLKERRSFSDLWLTWVGRFNLTVENLMRPLAVPLAGGVFSTVALFSTWVAPTYPVRAATGVDVPTMLNTAVQLVSTSPVGEAGADVVIDVIIDRSGRMVDYTVLQGQDVLKNPIVRRNLENKLLFTKFEPATSFGRPKQGKITLHLSTNRIEVKG